MAKKPYILYIEDELEMIDLVRKVLKNSCYEVAGVTCGEQALTMMEQRKPDLLLLDLRLPQLSGFEVYRHMKQDGALASVPVIVVSAYTPTKTRILAKDLPPVDEYILKPFKLTSLRNAVNEMLETSPC